MLKAREAKRFKLEESLNRHECNPIHDVIDIVSQSNSDSDSEADAEELYSPSCDLNENEQDECTNMKNESYE